MEPLRCNGVAKRRDRDGNCDMDGRVEPGMISHLEQSYRRFLQSRDTAEFISGVAQRYTLSTLYRLTTSNRLEARRAAVLAVSMIGGIESNEVLGRALHDNDRGVRLAADRGIRDIWLRVGDATMEHRLLLLARWNASGRFLSTLELANQYLESCGDVAELWHQRGVALFGLSDFSGALSDCREVLERNRYHFIAATAAGRCCMALDRPDEALEFFRHTLAINPTLEGIRGTVRRLERAG